MLEEFNLGGDILMVMTLTLACLLSASNVGSIWLDAGETSGTPLVITETAEYHLWAWAPRTGVERSDAVTIGEDNFDLPRNRDQKSDYSWYSLGSSTLKEGEHTVKLGEHIATLVATRDESYRPDHFIKATRVFDSPQAVADRRAQSAKHTDTVFTFPEYTLESWEQKARKLRTSILTSSGLWPLPDKTPLNTKIVDRIQHEDYSVEKVSYEAWPGYLVTGNLYRPVGEGPFPAVYSPHGHWEEGRLVNNEDNSVPGRSITLARMGAVVFAVDMVGYNDSMQFEHRWSSNELKLWGIHPFALQLWGGIRGLDFLEKLPDVDPERLGVTGASGGGTQTFALMAVDDRVKVAAPVNMISSTMQGGCVCENAPLIRFGNSNMEIGAMMAPRPLLMVSTSGDWTRETPHVEYPGIKSIYKLYDAEENVENVHLDYGHNYNKDSREAMYRFFGKHLIDPSKDWSGFTEPEFEMDSIDDLRMFNSKPDGIASGKDVIANIQKIMAQRDIGPANRDAIRSILGTTVPTANELTSERLSMERQGDRVIEKWIIGRLGTGDAIPAILYRSYENVGQDAVNMVSTNGKADWFDTNGEPVRAVTQHLEEGKAVLLIDPFLTGEHHSPYARTERLRIGAFMETFQPTDTGFRVQDILTAIAYLNSRRDLSQRFTVQAKGSGTLWAKLALIANDGGFKLIADDFSIDDDDPRWADEFYLPSILSIGGWSTIEALVEE